MKIRSLFQALAFVAVIAACTKENAPAEAPAMRKVTLSVEVNEPAGTRVGYTENGDAYRFTWTSTDKLLVLYPDDSAEGLTGLAEFLIDEIEADGKHATFTGALPEIAGKVLIVYSSRSIVDDGCGLYEVPFPGTTVTNDAPVADALAQNTFLYAYAEVGSSGNLPNVKLEHCLSYLLLKKGLKVLDNQTEYTLGSFNIYTPYSCITFELGIISSDYPVDGFEIKGVNANGCLTNDYLIPFMPEPTAFSLSIELDDIDDTVLVEAANQPSRTYQPGIIYEVAADNEKWAPIKAEPWDDDDDDYDDDDN